MNNRKKTYNDMLIDEMFQKASIKVNDADFVAAQAIYRDILSLCSEHPRALHALGVVMYRGGGNPEEAVCLVRQAIVLNPGYQDARCNLGNILKELNRFSEAEECYKSALEFNPDLSLAWHGLGDISCQNQLYEDALDCYGKATECLPNVATYIQIGNTLKIMGRLEDAAVAYRNALAIKDDCGEAYYGLASVYEAGANLIAASEYALQALKFLPASSATMQVLGKISLACGRVDEALLWYKRAIKSGGGSLAFSNMLFAMNYTQNCSQYEIFEESCRWEHVAAIYQDSIDFPPRFQGRLRIGYVSPDFKQHSVAYFLEPLLLAHNRSRFEIHCYSNVIAPDKVTARLKKHVEYWHDIRCLSDYEVIDKIKKDGIDILVDLAGHTADNRLAIFARRAAPVQMTWLGYPNTTGISAIDYRITDAVADPDEGSDAHHSERLIRLPDGFLCYSPPDDAPRVSPPPMLVNGFVTFGSLNNSAKITMEAIDLWCSILQAVPNSRLLLKSKTFCDPELAKTYSVPFVNRGLSEERVKCVPATETIANHLELYNQIDIALDTFPYNGTTTTFEALYMGVPVITLRGTRHAGRVGASILTRLAIAELIADTVDDYLTLAVNLSKDIVRLSAYHTDLRNQLISSTLVDGVRFADSLEDAYLTVWRTHCHRHPDELLPNFEDHFLAARMHCILGEYDQARTLYEEILTAQSDNSRALHGMGVVCHRSGDSESAIRIISRAVQLNSNYTVAWASLGNVHKETGRVREAIGFFQRAFALDPGFHEIHSNILMNMQYLREYSRDEIFKEARCWTDYHARRPFQVHLSEKVAVNNSGKIRIGFVSADFKKHPVGFIIIPFFSCYDRERFEFVLYSNSAESDEVTKQIISLVDTWRIIDGMADRAVWQLIHNDAVDILVDLSGHTAGNRLVLFSMRPAPILVSWLGYFDTTGLDSVDYLITDYFLVPPGEERWFTEKLKYLPDSRFCYAPPEYSPATAKPPALENGFVTFGTFNNIAKLTEDVIAVWAEILRRVNGSKLIIKWKKCCDAAVISRYQELFRINGLEPLGRVEFRGESGHQEMLREYGDVDIALDPFPFSGGLTSLEALWMGVPVITLKGSRPVSRQTASFLEILKRGELVADSVEQYINCALVLANDVKRLSVLRGRLREEMQKSPLCNAPAFTKNISDIFKSIVLCSQCSREPTTVFSQSQKDEFVEYYDVSIQHDQTEKAGVGEAFYMAAQVQEDFSTALLFLENKDFLGAAERFEQVLAIDPDNAYAHNNLGIAYFEIGFRDAAKHEFKEATLKSPDHAEAWKNLGKAIRDTGGNPERAARCFRKALSIAPDFDDAWMMLGNTLLDRGRSAEAVKCFQKTLELNPNNCDAHSNLLFAMNYIHQISQKDVFIESLKWNEIHAVGLNQLQHPIKPVPYQNKRLRIGYVSGDFKRHPVGYHLLPVLAAHDRERFDIFCYATLHEQDDVTEKMQGYIAGWRDISRLSDDDAATLISGDRIDILVDLAGHTKGNRLQLFACKPAPVQVTWLGYFNTTGLKAIDYMISDETTIPLETEQWFSERIIRLPGSRFCYAPPDYAPSVAVPPIVTNGFITFGSFNNIAKLTPEVIELWSRVMIAVPDSKLIIKWSTLGSKKVRDRLFHQFARHGVDSERLSLRGKSPHADMLNDYGEIDIALDPFPFSGGMTSCEALWMGVPVLTMMMGDKPVCRQTAGFLNTIGMQKWISDSPEQFVAIAKEVAFDLGELKSMRFGMRARMTASTLCDGISFTKNLEKLYCKILEKQVYQQQSVGDTYFVSQSSVAGDEGSDPLITANIFYNDGIDQMEVGNVEGAIRLFELAVSLNPEFACAYNNIGILKMQIGKVDEAEEVFRKALDIDLSLAEAYYNLGLVYEKTNRHNEAIDSFDAAVSLNSEYGEAYLEKGNVLLSLSEPLLALGCYEKAASLLSESAVTSNNIGTTYLQLGDKQQAEQFFCEALLFDPEYTPAYINLSTLFYEMERISEAEKIASAGLVFFPYDTRLLSVHARAMIAKCRIPEALQDLRRVLLLDSSNSAIHSSLLFLLQYTEDLSLETILTDHKSWSDHHVLPDTISKVFPNIPAPDRKLVIGYISPDFGRHPIGYFMMPVLPAHNRENFRVICYSDKKKFDDQTLMLESNADVWRETSGRSDQDLLELIASDGVDILVDLAGHTVENRLTLFARKAAPIQVTWAGYVGTTGLSTMDYLISDSNESPDYADEVTVEKIIRLPDCYVCYEPPDYAPEIEHLPALLNGYITFGCFNNLAKVNLNVVKLWAKLLQKSSTSRILLKTKYLDDQEIMERYRQLFTGYGIESERVILEGESRHADLLASYNRVDIALDPFPYSGGLTTLESLWMGVPVVTLGGERFCSRHSLSHLTALGFKETIAKDAEEYVSIALKLADDFGTLATLRSSLRARMAASPLCDGVKFTKELEAVYRVMWQIWVSK